MTKITHTPGPWKAVGDPPSTVHTLDGLQVADCSMRSRMAANSALIAAAPDLLAACKAAIAATEDEDDPANLPSEVLDRLNAAIARAEGGAA